MTIVLSTVPGFSDLQDLPLAATKPSIGAHLQRINSNASFGLVRLEVFTDLYANGDIVPQPVSPIDGYTYTRNELIYIWVPQSTANQTTGWASYREPWTMWYGIWNVNQATGEVLSEIGYRGNDDHKERQASTNDGVLQVFTIAQRQKNNLVLKSQPSFVRKLTTDFYVNEALHTGLMTALNGDAKFSVVNTEVIYMGEFANGATVPQPVSPADGRTYAYSECMFQTSWRWTADTDANGNPQKPAINKGQLQDWHASVDVSGGVRITTEAVVYELSGQHTYNLGKVAVFAFCQRPLGITFTTVQTGFSELVDSTFAPGSSLRVSTAQQLLNNVGQAVCTPEFFGPTNYSNGNTIPVPTSPLDGYVYQRSEMTYIWDWANTGPSANTTGRLSVVHGSISATGVVAINDYRLNSGASAVSLVHEGSMRVIVMAKRASNFGTPPAFQNSPPSFGSDDVIEFYGPNDRQTQYLDKGTGQVTVSTILNAQGSISPNQTITLTFTMIDTILHVTWLTQSLLRIDGSTLNLLASNATLGSNLVLDGDAESATVGSQAANWTFDNGNALLGANDFVHSGTKALKTINGTAANSFSHQTISGLINGRQYTLRGFIKTTALTLSGAGPGGAFLHVAAATGVTALTLISSAGGSTITTGTTDLSVGIAADGVTVWPYTFVEITFKPTGSGSVTLYVQLGFNVGGVSGTAWFDDVGLFPTGLTYTGLSNSTHYFLYLYIIVATGILAAANGTPPPTSPSDTFSQQAQSDGRIGVPPKNILTPSAGGTGSDTGGGDGTCPEQNELVSVRRYSKIGELLFDGTMRVKDVRTGFESDDGSFRTGDHIRGWSFAKNDWVYRAVHKVTHVPCSGWSRVKGRLLTPCEAVWWEDRWMAAWKTPGAKYIKLVSVKVLIEVEADWDDEHNYGLLDGDIIVLIIHNSAILPC